MVMYKECSPKIGTSVGRTSAENVNLFTPLNKKEDMALVIIHHLELPGTPVQQEMFTGCHVREIQLPVCAYAWDSALPGDQYILDRNQKIMSATSCHLQGEKPDHNFSSPGTKNVGLGAGKLLWLHILWHELLPHFRHAWRKESWLWLKHAVDKVESNCLSINSSRQPGFHALLLLGCNFLQDKNYVPTTQHGAWTIAKIQ